MRLLYLAHRMPYPPNKGDKIRAFNIIRYLAERHEVHVATLIDDPQDMAFVEDLAKIVTDVISSRIDGRMRKLVSLAGILRAESITVRHFYIADLQAKLDRTLSSNTFDGVVCSSSPTAEYLFRSTHWRGQLQKTVKVMDLIDVDSLKWQQYSTRSAVPKRWIYRYESDHLSRYERLIYREFDRLLLVSEQEKMYFPGGDPENKIDAIPNGVDLEFFAPEASFRSPAYHPTMVFAGMMDYWPNIEGMRWFVKSVFPKVQRDIPNVRLIIVGGKPTAEVLAWRSISGVDVTGFVEDIRDHIWGADVSIAPLRIARGVQNKVLEAMAMGKAIVTTPFALEGIRAKSDKELVVATEGDDFADCIVALLRDEKRRRQLGEAARRLVEEQYSWEHNLSCLDSLLAAGSGVDSLYKPDPDTRSLEK